MKRLVVHHTYESAVPFDLSRCGNHGIATQVGPNGAGSYEFVGLHGPGRVKIPLSPSLTDPRSIRVCIRFKMNMKVVPIDRHNLIEGSNSFALFVDSDHAVQATILDRNGVWQGPRSPAARIKHDTWHTADFRHDGVSHSRLFLDGVLVAERFDVPGPVRTPWAEEGIVVGAWPPLDDKFTFQGLIDEVMIYTDDPPEALELLDECCFDRDAADDLAEKVRDAGWDHAKVNAALQKMLDIGAEAAIAARAGDAARTKRLSALTKQAADAVKLRDPQQLAGAMQGIQAMMRERATPAAVQSLADRAWDAFADLPFVEGDPARFLLERGPELAKMLCLDGMLPPGLLRPPAPEPHPGGGEPDEDRPDGGTDPAWDRDLDDEPDPNSPVLGKTPGPTRPRPLRPPKLPRPHVARPDIRRPDIQPPPKPPRQPGDDD